MKINIDQEVTIERTIRVRQLESLFDIPAEEKLRFSLSGDLPIESQGWNVGLIVGPSGSGKTLTLQQIGRPYNPIWYDKPVIDEVRAPEVDQITEAFQAVGFNTVPNWMRPYGTLSNGEKFRVSLARGLVEAKCNSGLLLMDEFTSVVDRQVAKIGAFAVGKYARKNEMKFVAASCHYDIIDWLQPDWVFEPAVGKFQWRELQRPPEIEIRIGRVSQSFWKLFSRFHYKTQDMNKASRCYCLTADGRLASFLATLNRPHPHASDIIGATRAVTLPDWQGLGLAMILADTLGAAYTAMGKRFRKYPNHPTWAKAHLASPNWRQIKEQGQFSPRRGTSSRVNVGGSSCAVFEYTGPPLPREKAKKVLGL